MKIIDFFLFLSFFCLCFGSSENQDLDVYREIGFFYSPYAAFSHVGLYQGQSTLFMTSFGAGVTGEIHSVFEIGKKLGSVSSIQPELTATNLVWPNEVEVVPEEVFGAGFLLSCGGFLVPGYRTGKVVIIQIETGQVFQISTDEQGYFYHLGVWKDVDGDGLLDVLTAKTDVSPDGKLVWFKNPGNFSFPWEENLLVRGPDVFFRIQDVNGDGKEEIVASIFFRQRLSIFYFNNTFSDPNSWSERIIDEQLGAPFDVKISDLNFDGKLDLLVTNHQDIKEESAVFGYEIPENLVNGAFIKHILASGFETTQPGEGQASPGSAQAFYAQTSRTNEKPLICVSGDGTQRAHLLRPVSQDPQNWQYQLETIIFLNSTIGGIDIDDVDNDGYVELFIPSYNDGELHIFTFSPTN